MRRALALLALAVALPAAAITDGRALLDTDERFDAVGALAVTWRLGLDPQHADAQDHSWFCSATLVDELTVMTAAHCLTPYGMTAPYAVRFRRQLDGSVGSIDAGVASFFHAYVVHWEKAALEDVAYGTLAAPVTHIAPIALIRTLPRPGRALTLVGWGKQGPALGDGPAAEMRACANYVPALYTYGDFIAIGYGGPYGSPANIYANACGANNGDSGGPLLIIGPGRRAVPYAVGVIGSQNSGPRATLLLLPSDGSQAEASGSKHTIRK